jgi:hypothetical protein
MKFKPLFITVLTAITAGAAPVAAQPAPEPARPVLQAAIDASPGKRLEAARFYRAAYPGLIPDVYAQVKADYPGLEEGVVDAWLTTWEQYPSERMELAGRVKDKFGPRLQNVRSAVREEMETNYPDFRNRLSAVMDEHGPAARVRRYLSSTNPELLGQAQSQVRSRAPEWYPGKLREMWLNGQGGDSPVFDRLRGLVSRNPQLGQKLASSLVQTVRTQSPGLGEDLVRHFLDNRGELIDALQAEFPGAGDKIVGVIERTDPALLSEVARYVREEAAPIRADFRRNLEAELPGLEKKVRQTVAERYPKLQLQMLDILKG